jgi:hypothetical protein
MKLRAHTRVKAAVLLSWLELLMAKFSAQIQLLLHRLPAVAAMEAETTEELLHLAEEMAETVAKEAQH